MTQTSAEGEISSAVMLNLPYAEADAAVLADALDGYATAARGIITSASATGLERDLAAHRLVAACRLLRAAGRRFGDHLEPLTDAQRRRVAGAGADPYAIEALFTRVRVNAARMQ
jgi:hypothetical protein